MLPTTFIYTHCFYLTTMILPNMCAESKGIHRSNQQSCLNMDHLWRCTSKKENDGLQQAIQKVLFVSITSLVNFFGQFCHLEWRFLRDVWSILGKVYPQSEWRIMIREEESKGGLHSLKLTWPLKIGYVSQKETSTVFQPSICGCYVSFREG